MTEATTTTAHPTRRSLRKQRRRLRLPKIRPAAAFAVLTIAGMLAGAAVPIVSSAAPAQPHAARAHATQSMRVTGATSIALDRDSYTAKVTPKPLTHAASPTTPGRQAAAPAGKLSWPFGRPVKLSSLFGARSAPCAACSSYHQGVDMIPGAGTPIMAAASGTVREAEYGQALGNYVVIDQNIAGRRVSTMYAHMATLPLVSVGQTVNAGTIVGTVGNTGASTGPHLHFEVLLDGVTAVNPLPWLA
jgi:murein DD-endopeptidase MepM/ murein hydrolase activator NlpD